MTVELTIAEAELLIAVLAAADQQFDGAIALALRDLRPWRSALLQAYLRERTGTVTQRSER